ncbi:MAG: hypothetical protein MUC89_16505 [Acetobacteraceae bacterium]|jgi:hypothetical protein|nr:hypothetical protein [Acetobacteraceae bacterium]
MALLWSNAATSNRFAQKHLHIMPGSPALQGLVDEGYRIFNARVKAYKQRRNKSRAAVALKETYGANSKVTQNTLIVLSLAGHQGLAQTITDNGYQSGWYTLLNGVIFNMTGTGWDVGLVGKLHLMVRQAGADYEVWHLEDATITAPLPAIADGGTQLTKVAEVPGSNGALGLRYTPNVNDLAGAKAGLKKVGATLPNKPDIPMWAVQGYMTDGVAEKIDLSFLDD